MGGRHPKHHRRRNDSRTRRTSRRVVLVSRQMKNDPYQDLSVADRKIVTLIATAIANGNLLPNNKHSPLAARRVFEALKNACVMHCEDERLN